jgi:hypothetical protein
MHQAERVIRALLRKNKVPKLPNFDYFFDIKDIILFSGAKV